MRTIAVVTAFALIVNTLPVIAQGVPGAANGARLFSREAILRAVAAGDRGDPATQQSLAADWSKVAALKPGADIILLTAKSTEPAGRVVIRADDTGLMLLDVNAPSLPRAARDWLRDMAETKPEFLLNLAASGSWTDRDLKLKIGPEGLFVADRRVAAIDDVVMRIEKPDVVEIKRGRIDRSGFADHYLNFVGGFFLGFLGGAFLGGAISKAVDSDPSNLTGIFWGGMIGGVTTGIFMARRSAPDVIYRRP